MKDLKDDGKTPSKGSQAETKKNVKEENSSTPSKAKQTAGDAAASADAGDAGMGGSEVLFSLRSRCVQLA